MTIEELLSKRAELETTLGRLLAGFESETGVSIRDVRVHTSTQDAFGRGARSRVAMIEVDLDLGR